MNQNLRVGRWTVCQQSNQLLCGQEAINLEPQAMAVLIVLLTQRGSVVDREELIGLAWKGAVIGDSSLNRVIAQLRKAFDDDAKNPRYIETIPKKGYRLKFPTDKTQIKQDIYTSVFNGKRFKNFGVVMLVLVISVLLILLLQNTEHENTRLKHFTLLTLQHKLTVESGTEYSPDFSSDGRWMLYLSNSNEDKTNRLKIKSLGNNKTWSINSSDKQKLISPVFSPNSQQIAVVMIEAGHCTVNLLKQKFWQAEQLQFNPIARCSADFPPTQIRWGAKEDSLYITERVALESPYQINQINLKTSERKQITFPPNASWGDSKFDFDQRNGLLTFIRSSPFKQEIYLLDSRTGNLSLLPINYWGVRSLNWHSKEGELLLSTQDRVLRWSTKNNQETTLISGENIVGAKAFVNSEKIALVKKIPQADIYQLELKNGQTNKIIESEGSDKAPILIKDGEQIAYISGSTGRQQIWVADADGKEKRRITEFEQSYSFMSLDWSNSKQALIAWESSSNQIWKLDIKTGETKILFDSEYPITYPSFSSTEKLITFGSQRSGDWEMWSINSDGDDLKRLTFSGAYYGQFDDKRQSLYFTKFYDKGVWKKQLLLNSTAQILTAESSFDYPWWRLVGDSIYIDYLEGQGKGLYRYSLASRGSKSIEHDRSSPPYLFDVSADESMTVFSLQQPERGYISLYQ